MMNGAIHRRRWLTALATSAALPAWAYPAINRYTPAEVWIDPQCGCCHHWVEHMQAHAFQMRVHTNGNNAVRARMGLPRRLGSCHTALVGSYLVEGHVPASDVRELLRQKPVALGLAVPGMPVGSPGMDGPEYGNRRDPYAVLLVAHDGSTRIFKRHNTPQADT